MRYKLTGLKTDDYMCPEERELRSKIFHQDKKEKNNAVKKNKNDNVMNLLKKKKSSGEKSFFKQFVNSVSENIKDAGDTISDMLPENFKNINISGMLNTGVQKALNTASDITLDATKVTREGTYVRVTPNTHPRIFEIMYDVCDILDYHFEPEIYVYHQNDGYYLFPCGVDRIYLVISKRMLYEFDEDMLYYSFGNAISMVKSGHATITFLTTYIPSAGIYNVPKALLLKFVHAADITSDRGGLLACQSFAAVVRCHLSEAGFPFEIAKELFVTDDEANEYVKGYIEAYKEKNEQLTVKFFSGIAQWMQDIQYVDAPANIMLEKIYEWYNDPNGYKSIIKKYGLEER